MAYGTRRCRSMGKTLNPLLYLYYPTIRVMLLLSKMPVHGVCAYGQSWNRTLPLMVHHHSIRCD